MQLNIQRINSTSPYRVEDVDGMSCSFETRDGAQYIIGFADDYVFVESNAYQFFISNMNGKVHPVDQNVFRTVVAVLEEFFTDENRMLLYICDISDDRQHVRNRLFNNWFEQYEGRGNFILSKCDAVIKGDSYFMSLLISRKHPQAYDVVNKFESMTEDLVDKLNNQR